MEKMMAAASTWAPFAFNFNPYDREVIQLLQRVMAGEDPPAGLIYGFDINALDPSELPRSLFKEGPTKNQAFFLSRRQRSGSKGKRVKRTAAHGEWHGNAQKKIFFGDRIVGHRGSFTFIRKGAGGVKRGSDYWIMQEYTLPSDQFEATAICKVYNNQRNSIEEKEEEEEEEEEQRKKKKPRTTTTKMGPQLPSTSSSCGCSEALFSTSSPHDVHQLLAEEAEQPLPFSQPETKREFFIDELMADLDEDELNFSHPPPSSLLGAGSQWDFDMEDFFIDEDEWGLWLDEIGCGGGGIGGHISSATNEVGISGHLGTAAKEDGKPRTTTTDLGPPLPSISSSCGCSEALFSPFPRPLDVHQLPDEDVEQLGLDNLAQFFGGS